MNRLRYMDETASALENHIVKEVSQYDREGQRTSQGISIRMDGGITHRIFHSHSCCEVVKVGLPENIQNLHNRKISGIFINEMENELEHFNYEPLADVKIIDSHGEKYTIKFAGKSTGCLYVPHIRVEKEWVVCVFN